MPRTPGAERSNRDNATTDPTSSNDETEGWDIGSRWVNTTNGKVWFCVDVSTGAAVWVDVTATSAAEISIRMTLGGCIAALDLPFSGAGIEHANQAFTATTFTAWRGVPETSGTTTIQLEVNGSPVAGATLSWTSADAAFAQKSVSISQAVAEDDRISFRVTSAGVDAEDIFAEARS